MFLFIRSINQLLLSIKSSRTFICALTFLAQYSTLFSIFLFYAFQKSYSFQGLSFYFSLRFIEGVEEPRTSFSYNNLMYTLQGYITELLAGSSWEELVQTELYDKVQKYKYLCNWTGIWIIQRNCSQKFSQNCSK